MDTWTKANALKWRTNDGRNFRGRGKKPILFVDRRLALQNESDGDCVRCVWREASVDGKFKRVIQLKRRQRGTRTLCVYATAELLASEEFSFHRREVSYMLPYLNSFYFRIWMWSCRDGGIEHILQPSSCVFFSMKIMVRIVHTSLLLMIKLFRQNVVAVVFVVVFVAVAGRSLIYIFVLCHQRIYFSSEIEQRILLTNEPPKNCHLQAPNYNFSRIYMNFFYYAEMFSLARALMERSPNLQTQTYRLHSTPIALVQSSIYGLWCERKTIRSACVKQWRRQRIDFFFCVFILDSRHLS